MGIWHTPIIDGVVPQVVRALVVVVVLVLAVRRWRWRPFLWALAGAVAGAVVAVAVFYISNITGAFGDDLPDFVLKWSTVILAACGFAIGGMVAASAWRRVVSVIAVIVFLLWGVVSINAKFGLNPTLGSLFGMPVEPLITLPDAQGGAAPASDQPLADTWTAPAGMPAVGERGSIPIPGTVSGFDARDAGIYLPPAALVPNAPALPFVIMMMGQPGNPDPTTISDVLDRYAAEHDGLAPIVIVADQIGPDGRDPVCADSKELGNARTYVTVDVVAWAKQNLHIIDDPAYWTIAGYSNGGSCAITWGAQEPDVWKNIIDISGEEFAGSDHVDEVVRRVYGGSQSAFEASKPANIMAAAAPGTYAGTTAVFTAGSLDEEYTAAADTVSAAAKAAGMTVTRYEVPDQTHTGPIVELSLAEGFRVLYPVLGLSTG